MTNNPSLNREMSTHSEYTAKLFPHYLKLVIFVLSHFPDLGILCEIKGGWGELLMKSQARVP